MLSLEDVIYKVEEAFPDKYVSFVGKYKGNYLICAPRRDGSDLWTIPGAPYFVVNRFTGKIKRILPVDDLKGFIRARKHTLYERSEQL